MKDMDRRIRDVEDVIATVRSLNHAIWLAADGLNTTEHTAALQAVADEINNKLLVVRDRLDDIREQLG